MPELKAIFAQECIPTQSVICALVLQVNRREETINLTPTTAFFIFFSKWTGACTFKISSSIDKQSQKHFKTIEYMPHFCLFVFVVWGN